MVASTAAAGGSTATRMSSRRLWSARSSAGTRGLPRLDVEHAFEAAAQRSAEVVQIAAEGQHPGNHDRRADDRGPEHQMADRIPFEPAGRGPAGRASSAR